MMLSNTVYRSLSISNISVGLLAEDRLVKPTMSLKRHSQITVFKWHNREFESERELRRELKRDLEKELKRVERELERKLGIEFERDF